jgi:hypothetical protein
MELARMQQRVLGTNSFPFDKLEPRFPAAGRHRPALRCVGFSAEWIAYQRGCRYGSGSLSESRQEMCNRF